MAAVNFSLSTLHGALHCCHSVPLAALFGPQMLSEYRDRVLTGFKRIFHDKHRNGMLSSASMRILDHAVNVCLDEQDENKLNIWEKV
jgi:hypothetical protein